MAEKILLVTVTKVETTTVLDVFSKSSGTEWKRKTIQKKIYYYLGVVGGLEIYLVQSEMGSAGVGASLITVSNAIKSISPRAVIMVGIAFGVDPNKQKLGEILVSKQLMSYELGKIKGKFKPRGDRVPCSPELLDLFRSGDIDWKGAKVHFGLMLSGEKLIADQEFRDWLLEIEPEAIGGEMEGAGLFSAVYQDKVDWIITKGICDWADGNKNDEAQPLAAHNAARYVHHVLNIGKLYKSTGRVQVIIEGEFEEFNDTLWQAIVLALATLLKINKEQIRLLRANAGSIVLDLALPSKAIMKLLKKAYQSDENLVRLGITRINFSSVDITDARLLTSHLNRGSNAELTINKRMNTASVVLKKSSPVKRRSIYERMPSAARKSAFKDKFATPVWKLRKMSATDLITKLSNAREELIALRDQQMTGQLTDASRIHVLRREIVRIQSVLEKRSVVASAAEIMERDA